MTYENKISKIINEKSNNFLSFIFKIYRLIFLKKLLYNYLAELSGNEFLMNKLTNDNNQHEIIDKDKQTNQENEISVPVCNGLIRQG